MDEKWTSLRNRLFFQTDAADFQAAASEVCRELKEQKDAQITAEIAIDLVSYLVTYVKDYNEQTKIAAKAASDELLAALKTWNVPALCQYVEEETKLLANSSLIELSTRTRNKELAVHWGNDNGLGLLNAMRRGACFVTTNPPIVNMARQGRPEVYDAVRDEICKKYAAESVQRRVSRLTMAVVLDNCRPLYPLFEASNHRVGYVHYQVNPCNFEDSDAMTEEIRFAYGEMKKALGGTPNVLFKVPGTKAALKTVEDVSKDGIGVTITVNFSAAQSEAFAKRIQAGTAERSFVVLMAGRLDSPVEEDLKAAGVEDANTLARGASRCVTWQIYHEVLLKLKFSRVGILVASLRGPWNVEASLTNDQSSDLVVSCFPDKWQAFETRPCDFVPALQQDLDTELVKKLDCSDTFRKAFYLDGLQPDEFDGYRPVVATLNSFIQTYHELEAYMEK